MDNKSKTIRKDARRDGKYYDSALNTRIRERMEHLGLNAVSLRNELKKESIGYEVSAEAIRQWVSGYAQPKIDNIPAIAKGLQCTIAYLFMESDVPNLLGEEMTVESMGLSAAATEHFASIAGAAKAYLRRPNEADILFSPVGNPNNYPLKTEANAFFFLDKFLKHPDCVKVLNNAMQYITHASNINPALTANFTIADEEGTEDSFSAPGSILLDALWARVTNPFRDITDELLDEEVKKNGKQDR